jgi:ABC-type sugar transport system, periplasmic component
MKKVGICIAVMGLAVASLFAAGEKEATTASTSGNAVRTVEFWHTMSGVNGGAIDKIAESFNATIGKEKGIVVKSVFQGNDNSEKLKTLAQAGDTKNFPDVCQIVGAGIPSAVGYEQLVPVQTMFEKGATLISKDDIEPNMLRAYTYEDTLIGMPVSCSALLLYYNKDMFNEAGIENPPATIDEMAKVISRLMVKKGNDVERYGLNVAVRRYQMANFIGGQGDYNFFGDNEGGRKAPMTHVTFGDDGTLRKYLTEWQKVIATGGYKPMEDDINEEFALQLHAMVMMSTARIGKIRALVGDAFNWGVAPIPKVDPSDKGGISVGGSCVVMFDPDKDPAQVEAAWEFVQYLASPEIQFQFHKDTGYIPVNKKVYSLPGIDEHFAANPEYKVAVDAIHASNANVQEPFDIINWEIDAVIKNHMLAFAEGRETLDQCHDGIVNECNEKLDAYHKAND